MGTVWREAESWGQNNGRKGSKGVGVDGRRAGNAPGGSYLGNFEECQSSGARRRKCGH